MNERKGETKRQMNKHLLYFFIPSFAQMTYINVPLIKPTQRRSQPNSKNC